MIRTITRVEVGLGMIGKGASVVVDAVAPVEVRFVVVRLSCSLVLPDLVGDPGCAFGGVERGLNRCGI